MVNNSAFDWKESSKSPEPNPLFKQPAFILSLKKKSPGCSCLRWMWFTYLPPHAVGFYGTAALGFCHTSHWRLCFCPSWGVWRAKVSVSGLTQFRVWHVIANICLRLQVPKISLDAWVCTSSQRHRGNLWWSRNLSLGQGFWQCRTVSKPVCGSWMFLKAAPNTG